MLKPNIVLTFADDQRHSMLGCNGGATADAVRTPHLDALAARGALFTHAYHAGSPQGAVCVASRAMLHTGRGPFDTPPDMARHALGPAYSGSAHAQTLGQLLHDAGYATHFVGKWHNGEESLKRSFESSGRVFMGGMGDPFDRPLHQWDGHELRAASQANVHSTEVFSEDARDWLRRYGAGREGDRPFFLCVAFTSPHDPRRTHRQWHNRYREDQIALPPNFMGEHPFDNGHMNNRDERLTPRPRDQGQTRSELADYHAMTEHMDHGIGRIHQLLEDLELSENTLVIHSADHGLAVGQHGLMGKQNLYDHSVRVPLIVAGPGVPAGLRPDGLCYQHDLFPTLLEAGGAEVPPGGAFKSLWPMIRGERRGNYELIGCFYEDGQRMVTDGRSKLIHYRVGGKVFEQCFDLQADPWERMNEKGHPLSPSHSIGPADLRRWQEAMGDPMLSLDGSSAN